ncbi:MAG: glucose-6-phosphate isomerase [Campylobacterota bacterium]|nr:glucose-6-phosphate isomerase [Campylobacterota bacterium]
MLSFERRFDPKIGKKSKEFIQSSFEQMIEEKNSNKVGYYTLPDTTEKLLKNIDTYIKNNKDLQENKITDIVVIGIGGSSLGTKAIDAILEHKKETNIDISFLENGDPISINKILKKIQKSSTIFIVISKSGTTIETTSIFKYVLKRFDIKLDSKDTNKLLAITDEDSPLWQFAKQYNISKFSIPKNVGGRFSVLSAVGLVPLAIMGYDIKAIIKGAAKIEKDFFNKKAMHLIEKAYFYYKQGKNKPINVLFSYSSQFDYFNQWYVQLWGESLGKFDKTHKKVGLTPVGLVGSVDQHSFLQLVMQGPEDKTLTFIKVEDFENRKQIPDIKLDYITGVNYINNHTFNELINAQCMATMESVSEAGIPTDMITVDKLNEENLGYLIYYYELLTSCVGVMFNINTYDQPGVEFGKKKLVKKFVKEN